MSRANGRGGPVTQWGSRMKKSKPPAAKDIVLERLLLAIEVHGPSSVYEAAHMATIRDMRRNYQHGFRQVIEALRECGLGSTAIADIMQGGRHPVDCACWRCVLRLYSQVAKARATICATSR